MLGTDVTMDMARAKELEPIRNKQLYEAAAKAEFPHTNVDAGKIICFIWILMNILVINCVNVDAGLINCFCWNFKNFIVVSCF